MDGNSNPEITQKDLLIPKYRIPSEEELEEERLNKFWAKTSTSKVEDQLPQSEKKPSLWNRFKGGVQKLMSGAKQKEAVAVELGVEKTEAIVGVVAKRLGEIKVFKSDAIAFFGGMAGSVVGREVAKQVVFRMGLNLGTGFVGAVAGGAVFGAVGGASKEYVTQLYNKRKTYQQEVNDIREENKKIFERNDNLKAENARRIANGEDPEKNEDLLEIKKRKFLEKITPENYKKLGKAVARGAVIGAIGGGVADGVLEVLHHFNISLPWEHAGSSTNSVDHQPTQPEQVDNTSSVDTSPGSPPPDHVTDQVVTQPDVPVEPVPNPVEEVVATPTSVETGLSNLLHQETINIEPGSNFDSAVNLPDGWVNSATGVSQGDLIKDIMTRFAELNGHDLGNIPSGPLHLDNLGFTPEQTDILKATAGTISPEDYRATVMSRFLEVVNRG